LGWLNRIAQLLPIQSWKWIVPWVVSAVKSGASELILSDIATLPDRFSVRGTSRLADGAASQRRL
jgi:hypothetical protein